MHDENLLKFFFQICEFLIKRCMKPTTTIVDCPFSRDKWILIAVVGMQQDQFQRLLPTFIQVIDLSEAEELEYWNVMSAVSEGKQIDSISFNSTSSSSLASSSGWSTPMEDGINNKVVLLRTMLQWEEQLRSEAGFEQPKVAANSNNEFGEIAVVWWPDGEIVRLTSGSTAADAATRVGLQGKLVSVNGQVVLPNTQLKDGDVIQVRVR